MTKQPPMNPSEDTPQDVLTLHRGVFERWVQDGGHSLVGRLQPAAMGATAERLMAHLPGLASMTGTFSSQAWELAAAVSSSRELLSRLGLPGRSLQVGDLADIIQLVLEEEQQVQQAEGELTQSRQRVTAAERAAATVKGAKKPVVSAPSGQARKVEPRRAAPAQGHKLRAVRQLLAELRQREVRALSQADQSNFSGQTPVVGQSSVIGQAPFTGVSRPDMGGDVGHADPSLPAGQGPDAAHKKTPSNPLLAAGLLPSTAQTPIGKIAQAAQTRSAIARIGRTLPARDRWLDPLAAAQDVAGSSRSLRMAEQAADLALLQPGIEVPTAFGREEAAVTGVRSAAASQTTRASTTRSGAQAVADEMRAIAAPKAHALQGYRPDANSSLRAAASSPAATPVPARARTGVTAATWAAAMARRPAASGSAIARQADALLTLQTMQAVGVGAQDTATIAAGARSPRALDSAGQATRAAGQATASAAQSSSFAAPGTASVQGALSALGGSLALAARQLSRWQGFAAAAMGKRMGGVATPSAGTLTQGQAGGAAAADLVSGSTPVAGASRPLNQAAWQANRVGSPMSRGPAGDRFAALFDQGPADRAATQAVSPRWASWLASSEAALQGRSPAASATQGRSPGYAASAQGVGDWLALGSDAVDASPSDRAVTGTEGARALAATSRDLAARTAPAAGLPSWIAPRAANMASAHANRASMLAAVAGGERAVGSVAGRFAPDAIGAVGGGELGGTQHAASHAGLRAIGMSARLSDRLLAGLEPQAESHGPAGLEIWAAQSADRYQVGTKGVGVPATLLAAASGAGEWLDAGSDGAAAEQDTAGTLPADATRRLAAIDKAAPAATKAAQAKALRQAARADARPNLGLVPGRRDQAGPAAGDSRASATVRAGRVPAAAWARAAAAAIERVVAQSARAGRLGELARHVGSGRSLVDFAAGSDASLLAATPFGARDALTPWIERQLARHGAGRTAAIGATSLATSQGSKASSRSMANGAETELVALQPDVLDSGEIENATSGRGRQTTAASAGAARFGSSQPSAAGTTSTARANTATAALQSRLPAALRAALAGFGDNGGFGATGGGARPDAATAFLARWFGRMDVLQAPAPARSSQAHGGAGETLRLGAMARGEDAMAAGSPMAAARAAIGSHSAAPDQLVLTGLSALAAMQRPLSELDAIGDAQAAARQMRTADVERQLLAPSGDQREASEAPMARASAGTRGQRTSNAVQLHQFVPVGLRHGRDLLSSTRRGAGVLHLTPRAGFAAGVGPVARAGYGSAELGGGELIGLGASDTTSFHGDAGPMPNAARGADRLSGIVQARRLARTGRGHAAAVGAGPSGQRTLTGGDGPGTMPSDFSFGDKSLVNPAAAMQAAVSANARNHGGTAANRGVQAGAMARVLSVTSEPGSNVLPLVAPAASALVSAAAAKPLSESIGTSGADPTMGMPMLSDGKKSKGGGGGEGASAEGQGEQDLEALASKIARSIMVRIKRERERRGIHG